MDALTALIMLEQQKRQSEQQDIETFGNLAKDMKMQSVVKDFVSMPDKSPESIKMFAAEKGLSGEDLKQVMGIAHDFSAYADTRKKQSARDALSEALKGSNGGMSPEVGNQLSQLAIQDSQAAQAVGDSLKSRTAYDQQQKSQAVYDELDNYLKGNADLNNPALANLLARVGIQNPQAGYATTQSINSFRTTPEQLADREDKKSLREIQMLTAKAQLDNAQNRRSGRGGGLTQYQRNQEFDKFAKQYRADRLMDLEVSIVDGKPQKNYKDLTGKEYMNIRRGIEKEIGDARRIYSQTGVSPQEAFGSLTQQGTQSSDTTTKFINDGKGKQGSGGTGVPWWSKYLKTNQDETSQQPQNKQPATQLSAPTQPDVRPQPASIDGQTPSKAINALKNGMSFSNVRVDPKSGTVWATDGQGKLRRIAVKPPQKIYNNQYDNPEYASYFELINMLGTNAK